MEEVNAKLLTKKMTLQEENCKFLACEVALTCPPSRNAALHWHLELGFASPRPEIWKDTHSFTISSKFNN